MVPARIKASKNLIVSVFQPEIISAIELLSSIFKEKLSEKLYKSP